MTIRRAYVVGVALAIVVVVVAVVGVVYVQTGRPSPWIVPGYMEESYPDGLDAKVTVELPYERLTLSVGEPVRTVPAYTFGPAIGGLKEADAGRNARIVSVGWDGEERDLDGPMSRWLPHQFGLVLISDGERYDLRPDSSQSARTVVVDGLAEHLRAEVTYEGVVQTVDLVRGKVLRSGRAAGYYQGSRTRRLASACEMFRPDQSRFARSVESPCTLGPVTSEPYLPELGWAPKGTTWWSVPAEVSWSSGRYVRRKPGEDPVGYGVHFVGPLAVTLDGHVPHTVLLGHRIDSYGASGYYVFALSTPPSRLHVSAPFVGQMIDEGPGPRTVRLGPDQDISLE